MVVQFNFPHLCRLEEAKANENERRQSAQYCHDHPSAQFCQNLSGKCLSTLLRDARNYTDLVNRLHTKTILMCNFGLNGGVPWLFVRMGPIFYL